MSTSKTYNPAEIEDKWYSYWEEQGLFNSKPDEREPYTILMPPPNVTGMLHMGHMLNNTIQDILIRKARLEGKNACWVPGTDHASIATEAKVVQMLNERGIDKNKLSREQFLKYAWEWKEKYGGIILKQLRKLGASADWSRTTFTMDDEYYKAVIKVFVDLYNKGHIYRGVRMINWDPKAKTALSDEEVNYKEVNSKLYYVRYKIKEEEDSWITIATTRPETILGDTAICVNPNDERYKHLKGKTAVVPMVERSIPIIFDDYVDPEFGTGALKVTPAHDINDYELGMKHNLEVIDVINDDGAMSEAAQFYIGEDREVVRKKIADDLADKGQLLKIEELRNKVGFSERTDAVIEPKLSTQWFLKMKELSKPALENVMNDEVEFFPKKFKNTYRHWMENIKDWCISRQLWWGQRIPVYYLPDGSYIVAESKEEAIEQLKIRNPKSEIRNLRQDEDVLDTWFSSWLWPIAVFDGFKDIRNKEIEYYNPTQALVTAPEIMFFWVARMIIANYEYLDKKPFEHVYYTGIVRDKQRRKMSKSLGNSPDPLDLIKEYGADGVRFGILISSPAGNDLLFDDKLCEQGRNFANKIWNALRLVKGWEVSFNSRDAINRVSTEWFEQKLNQKITELEENFRNYSLSEALKILYTLIWDDFCSWYLEMAKPARGEAIDNITYEKTIHFFEKLMQLLHPFMPFLTEEIYQSLKERDKNDSIMVSDWPKSGKTEKSFEQTESAIKEVVTHIRNIRKENDISPSEKIDLLIKGDAGKYKNFELVYQKLAGVKEVKYVDQEIEAAKTFITKDAQFFIPVEIDAEEEREKLQKELEYTQGFLISVEKKLSNERFVQSAPEQVVEKERQKQADALARVKTLKESLERLN